MSALFICVLCCRLRIIITYLQCPVCCIRQPSSNVFNDQFSTSNLQRQGIVISLPALKFSFKHLYLLIFLILLSSAIFLFHSFPTCLTISAPSSGHYFLVTILKYFQCNFCFSLHTSLISTLCKGIKVFLLFIVTGPFIFVLVHDHLH